jgi:tetratricopeptide (TPR) repeat protein
LARRRNQNQIPRFLSSTRALQRAVWLVWAALAASLVVFGIYYVADRYVHPNVPSAVERGIEQMEQAIREEPQNAEMRVALAETYLAAGEYAEALDQAEQVLALYPENGRALLIAGIGSARLDRPEAAVDALNRFIALRKDEPMANADQALETAYYFVGESYVKLERPAEAIPALEAALVINRTDADALYQLGLAYQGIDQAQAAVECYHRTIRLVPDFFQAYQGMVASYTALGETDRAAYARGMEAFCVQDYELAARSLERVTGTLPDFAPAFLGMGLTYERMGRLEAALAAVQRAYELDPHDLAAQQAMGRIQAALDSED